MKIAQSNIALQSEHTQTKQHEVKESMRMWVDRPAPVAQPSVKIQISVTAQSLNAQSSEATAIEEAAKDAETSPQMQLIRSLVEMLTGQKVRVFDPSKMNAPVNAGNDLPQNANGQPAAPQRAGFGVEYHHEETYAESETTSMQAQGTIKTSDGQEIQFDLKMVMQRQYSETSSTTIRIGDAARKTDPLVINFNGTAAQLSNQTFAFDLNNDGKKERISQLQEGSGYLALDQNSDGKINSGAELFGPNTGNGFSELAQYDADKNGWIDESDPVFQQLKVWLKDASGNDALSSLSSLGVGAISLSAVATPFDIKTADNQTLGSVRASSVYLNEGGKAGAVQQIDLAV